jgi:hypothetical protein
MNFGRTVFIIHTSNNKMGVDITENNFQIDKKKKRICLLLYFPI